MDYLIGGALFALGFYLLYHMRRRHEPTPAKQTKAKPTVYTNTTTASNTDMAQQLAQAQQIMQQFFLQGTLTNMQEGSTSTTSITSTTQTYSLNINGHQLTQEQAQQLIALVKQDQKLEAIKLLRQWTDAGLAESKSAVEQLAALDALLPQIVQSNTLDEAAIVAALHEGNKLEAVKRYKEQTGMGLKESKDAVEEIAKRLGL